MGSSIGFYSEPSPAFEPLESELPVLDEASTPSPSALLPAYR